MEKVLVALSGGVDSSTAAAILKQKGYSVEGAIMLFEGVTHEAHDYAHEATKKLSIPFHGFDFTKAFHNKIISNFIKEYSNGRTPNPCILCNKYIKFGLFLKKAEEMGIDKIATGHYACIEEHGGHFFLKKGKDKNEQSYFLYRLDQQQLAKTILPLGTYTKDGVRKMAQKYNLPTAQRRKSQDVCFIPDNDYSSYLKDMVPQDPGPIYDKDGEIIGMHKGIISYTCGQRRGIGVSRGQPYYVLKIDVKNNAVYVGDREDVYRSQLIAGDVHFMLLENLDRRIEVMAKTRYVSPLSQATLEPYMEKRVKVTFKKAQWALTPGQSVVFYQHDTVLGGGIIEEIV